MYTKGNVETPLISGTSMGIARDDIQNITVGAGFSLLAMF